MSFQQPRYINYDTYDYGHTNHGVLEPGSDSARTSDGLDDSDTSDIFNHYNTYLGGYGPVGYNHGFQNAYGYNANYGHAYNNYAHHNGYGGYNNYGGYNHYGGGHNNYGYGGSPSYGHGYSAGYGGAYVSGGGPTGPLYREGVSNSRTDVLDGGNVLLRHGSHGHLLSDDEYNWVYEGGSGYDAYGNKTTRRNYNYSKGPYSIYIP